jgi:YVTN family beta-propeller protein/predicted outer membrane repeat protein
MRRSTKLVLRVCATSLALLGLCNAGLHAAPVAYITNRDSGILQPVDVGANPSLHAGITTGGNPYGVAVSPDGARVYVADENIGVVVIAAATGQVVTAVPTSAAVGIAVSPDGAKVYAASIDTDSGITVIDTATNTVSGVLPVPEALFGIAVSPDGSRIYATADLPTGALLVINATTGSVIASIPTLGFNPFGVAVSSDGTRVYAADGDAHVLVLNAATNASIGMIAVGTTPLGIATTPGGGNVYVTNRDSNTVSVLSPASNNAVIATIPVGMMPRGVAVSADGTRAYAVNTDSNSISVIDTATLSVVSTIALVSAVCANCLGPVAFGKFLDSHGQSPQMISFTSAAPGDGIVGVPYAVTATASSGLPVTLSINSQDASSCTISGNTVSFVAPGVCRIEADQAGDTNFAAAHAEQFVGVPCYVNAAATGANNGTSWANGYTSLQSALTSCRDIWVAHGIYKPGVNSSNTFLVLPLMSLLGGFAGTETSRAARNPHKYLTVLSGDIDNNDAVDAAGIDPSSAAISGTNSQTIVTLDASTPYGSIGPDTLIDGFTITGGSSFTDGGGLRCSGNSDRLTCSPDLRNLVFSGNKAASGAAMFNDGSNGGESSPHLSNITFSGNTATTAGGAIYNNGSGGVANPVLTNVTFVQNASVNGGAMYNDGTSGQSNPALSFVTFTANHADNCGGALFNAAANGTSHPGIMHSVLWNDSSITYPAGGEICNSPLPEAYASIGGSLVQGSGGSTNWDTNMGTDMGFNIDANPLLGPLQYNGGTAPTVVPDQAGAAFNAANNCADAFAVSVAADQRGVRRPYAGTCDIGAVESSFDRIFADGLDFAPL